MRPPQETVDQANPTYLACPVEADAPLFIAYTLGTTGRSKGVTRVWMLPAVQEDFERFGHVIGCVHVSGLNVRR